MTMEKEKLYDEMKTERSAKLQSKERERREKLQADKDWIQQRMAK